jgi:hypothetical protein
MGKSAVEQVKDIVIYAPIGLIKMVRNNASTVLALFANQGKPAPSRQPQPVDLVPEDEDLDTKSRAKKAVKKGVANMTSDITKQRSLLNTALGAAATLKDNASALTTFSTSFEERGKKEMDQKVQAMSEKLPSKKSEEPVVVEESSSVVGQCIHTAVDTSTAVVSGVIDVAKAGVNFGVNTGTQIIHKLRNTSVPEEPHEDLNK